MRDAVRRGDGLARVSIVVRCRDFVRVPVHCHGDADLHTPNALDARNESRARNAPCVANDRNANRDLHNVRVRHASHDEHCVGPGSYGCDEHRTTDDYRGERVQCVRRGRQDLGAKSAERTRVDRRSASALTHDPNRDGFRAGR